MNKLPGLNWFLWRGRMATGFRLLPLFGIGAVTVACFLIVTFLFGQNKHVSVLTGVVTDYDPLNAARSRSSEKGHWTDFYMVRLDDGRIVRAAIPTGEKISVGKRVQLKKFTTRLFGYEHYQLIMNRENALAQPVNAADAATERPHR